MLDWKPGAAFGPTEIRDLRLALERACRALEFAFPNGDIDAPTREQLAIFILELAAAGEASPARLSAEALRSMPPFEAAHLVSVRAA